MNLWDTASESDLKAPLGHVAIDGKRLRGSAPAGHDGRQAVHLVSAFATRLRAVVGQIRVEPSANENTTALAQLKTQPLAGSVIIGDAAFCQHAICQSAHYQWWRLPVDSKSEPAAADGRQRRRRWRRFPQH